ncbi:unnamed protein product [Trifolium pratense]|uniref:Uncharacterized protein n=1 Tax=Trifolium pratense TaxID=57577 RepID=A0ACB0L2I3_TRIPR|nr:unnamed protein product [Trifolium pratense]
MEGVGQAFILSEEQKLEWAELEKLAIKIIELMANALAINPKEMTELFNIGTQIIRIITNGIYPIIVHRATVNSPFQWVLFTRAPWKVISKSNEDHIGWRMITALTS